MKLFLIKVIVLLFLLALLVFVFVLFAIGNSILFLFLPPQVLATQVFSFLPSENFKFSLARLGSDLAFTISLKVRNVKETWGNRFLFGVTFL